MNHAFKATYFRTALLLGLIRGDIVHEWAEQVIAGEEKPPAPFIDLIAVSVDDLSGMRHALWPLVVDPPPLDVLHAVLRLLHADLAEDRRSLEDTLTVVRQLRSMVKLPPPLYAELNDALVNHSAGTAALTEWLTRFAGASTL